MAGSDSGTGGGGLGLIPESMRERAFWALLAFALGTGGAFSYLKMDPPRPDPWTGTNDRETMARFESELKEYIDQRLVLCEAHMREADAWKSRIRSIETRLTIVGERIDSIAEDHRGWRYQLKMQKNADRINGDN